MSERCDDCPAVQALATARGVSVAVVRLSLGISERHVCQGCGQVWDSLEAAAACAAYDDTTD